MVGKGMSLYLQEIENEIENFDISHWLLKSVNAVSTATISIANGMVFLALNAQTTAVPGDSILHFPYKIRPNPVYLPPGYRNDTFGLYYSNESIKTTDTLTNHWVRRQWSWYIGKGVKVTKDDLRASPPPVP